VEAVLRRTAVNASPAVEDLKAPFTFANFTVDPRAFKLTGSGGCDISKRELDLIRLFADHPGEVLDRDTLLNKIWGFDYSGTTRTLDQHIAMLRKKIEPDPSVPRIITTVHGIGYRFNG